MKNGDPAPLPVGPALLDDYLSKKIKILALLTMGMVVVVHAYNLTERYLQPGSMVQDAPTVNAFLQLFLANGWARFAIPLFFLISGYLNYPQPGIAFGTTVRKRMRTLLVPYLLWSAVGLLIYWLAQHNDLLWRASQKAALGAFSDLKVQDFKAWQLLFRWLVEPLPFQLWFLRCLFFYTLLTPLLLRGLQRAAPWLLGCFGLLWFINAGLYVVEGEGLLFFSLGLWLRHRAAELRQPPRWFRWWPLAVCWVGLLLLKTSLAFGPYDFTVVTVQVVLYRLCELLGVLVIWFGYDRLLGDRLPRPGWLILSRHTFIIYGLHVPLLHLLSEGLFLTYGETDTTRSWVFMAVIISIIATCVFIGMLLRRFVPSIFRWLTGDRGI